MILENAVSTEGVSDGSQGTENPSDNYEPQNEGGENNESQAPAKQTKKEEPPKYKFKFKIDKEEREAEYDHETTQRLIQKGLGADKRFNEIQHKAMELEKREAKIKEANSRLTDKQVRRQALRELGIDPVAFAEELLMEELEEQSLSPEERRIKELEAFKKQKEEEEKTLEEQYKAYQQEKEYKQIVTDLDSQITDILKTEGVEKNLETVERILQYMRAAHASGQDLSVPEIVAKLKESSFSTLKSMVSGKKIDELAKILGEDTLKQLNDHFLKKRTNPASGGGVKIVPRETKQEKITDPQAFFRSLGK